VIKALPRKLYRDIVPEAIVRKAETTNEVLPLPPAPITEPTTAVKAPQSQCEEQSSSNKKRCIRSDEAILSCAKQIEGDRCVICMDDFDPTDEVVMLPCNHFHHIPCTEGWLAVRLTHIPTYPHTHICHISRSLCVPSYLTLPLSFVCLLLCIAPSQSPDPQSLIPNPLILNPLIPHLRTTTSAPAAKRPCRQPRNQSKNKNKPPSNP
jgi:hypothetical protein